ncbi:MAG: 4Fe-4S binding protein, partial [Thermoleophilia bacterium]|nr:4Fe-4S binding protein [Thermoleophilia bacterium]
MVAKGKSPSNERKARKVAGFRLSAQLAFLAILGAQILLWYGAGVMVFGKLSPRVFFATAKGMVTAATLFWGAIFVSAAVFGPIYCGWFCAFGTYQDFMARVLPQFGGGGGRRRDRPSFINRLPGPVRRVVPYAKYALLAFLLSRTAVDALRNPPKRVVINLA